MKDRLDNFMEWCPPVVLFVVGVVAFPLFVLGMMALPPKWTGINNWRIRR